MTERPLLQQPIIVNTVTKKTILTLVEDDKLSPIPVFSNIKNIFRMRSPKLSRMRMLLESQKKLRKRRDLEQLKKYFTLKNDSLTPSP